MRVRERHALEIVKECFAFKARERERALCVRESREVCDCVSLAKVERSDETLQWLRWTQK